MRRWRSTGIGLITFGLLVVAPWAASAQTTWLVKAGYDAVKAESGLSKLTEAVVKARSTGVLTQLDDAQALAAVLRTDPKLASDPGVLEFLRAAEEDAVNLSFDGLKMQRELQGILRARAYKPITGAGMACAGGPDCLVGLASAVDAAAVQAAMGTVEQGQIVAKGGTVAVGETLVPGGALADLLSQFSGAEAMVKGARTTSGPAAFVPWNDMVWIRGNLRRLRQPEGPYTHTLTAGGSTVRVTADMRLDQQFGQTSWYQIVRQSNPDTRVRTLQAIPVGN